jgi:hypothetical protein
MHIFLMGKQSFYISRIDDKSAVSRYNSPFIRQSGYMDECKHTMVITGDAP